MASNYILTLNAGNFDSLLHQLKKHSLVKFRLGANLMGKHGKLLCNYPLNEDLNFHRETFYRINLKKANAAYSEWLGEIFLDLCGSFNFKYVSSDGQIISSGYLLVEPELHLNELAKEILPLNCVQCQTVISKYLGPFNTWKNKLLVAKESGYNMIHFTPIQKLGVSNSAYSIEDQMCLNPIFQCKDLNNFTPIKSFLKVLRKEWKMLSIGDVVLNHTANESFWLHKHPEASYNCYDCPYLRPAYLLDAALHQFSIDVKNGLYEHAYIPSVIYSEDHLNSIRYVLHTEVLSKLALRELFICDVDQLLEKFGKLLRTQSPNEYIETESTLQIVQNKEYERLKSTIDIELALKMFNVFRNDCFDEETRIQKCIASLKRHLEALNAEIDSSLNNHLNAAVENVLASIRYYRVQEDGPKYKEISESQPLIYRYFTDTASPKTIQDHENVMYDSTSSQYLMAHNGWVMNADPLENFADFPGNVYLRRELIAWGDSVKLRYGSRESDNPYLWQLMKEYVAETASLFDGVRLDNCHSTPIHVAEFLLDHARKINPNLYVVAELFTNSNETDNIFVNRLGITSLIREAMSAWNSHELGRLIYRYGGNPVGAFRELNIQKQLMPSIAHAIFFDATHDNPSLVEKRTVYDLLPNTALVNMACCASGSNRGYDELVPHHIHVVDEKREYAEFSMKADATDEHTYKVNLDFGILRAKKVINDLHFKLSSQGFNQVFVDQIDSDIVAVTRNNPITHASILLVAFTAFNTLSENDTKSPRFIKPLNIEGYINQVLFECKLTKLEEPGNCFSRNKQFFNGLTNVSVEVSENIAPNKSRFLIIDKTNHLSTKLKLKEFVPGCIIALEIFRTKVSSKGLENLTTFLETPQPDLQKIFENFTLKDFNTLLYRCHEEEQSDGFNKGVYDVPNFGPLVYCGLQGVLSLLSIIRPLNDLGHPLCINIRQGDWLIEYIFERLNIHKGTREFSLWFQKTVLQDYKSIPTYLKPAYFDAVITKMYSMALKEIELKMSSRFISNGSDFVRELALGSIQFCAFVKNAKLPKMSPKLEIHDQELTTLAAGLPHFTTGYMRNWGRDTFIALRGLLLLTNRHLEARFIILGYAGCLRHGLIPNLLDGGYNARYNCRDAVWWWLYSIKCYVSEVPMGHQILKDPVSRIFPDDNSLPQIAGECDQRLEEVMQEALKVHFQGLAFRERNAGTQIDAHMSDRGFNNQIGVHPETGFVFGGNEYNCGTWMDKMGSSVKAGNKGVPATPRDGSAIEIIGLSKAVVSWLADLFQLGLYPYDSVERTQATNGVLTKWTFTEWANRIQKNFESYFWVDQNTEDPYKNVSNIYKDTYGATQRWADFQLRCNFPIAMVTAPELFNPLHAWQALKMAEKHLLGRLGMKTLDASDWNYCGDYDNSNDGNDNKIAHGFNYHQGPEWLWPVGYYLRACLLFGKLVGKLNESVEHVQKVLANHYAELQASPWKGLPELTNADGAFCKDSNPTQAWSMSCLLEVLYEVQKIGFKND